MNVIRVFNRKNNQFEIWGKKGQNRWDMIIERTLNKLESSTTEDLYEIPCILLETTNWKNKSLDENQEVINCYMQTWWVKALLPLNQWNCIIFHGVHINTYLTFVEFVNKAKLPVVDETVTTETDLSLLIAVPGLVVSMEMKVDHA